MRKVAVQALDTITREAAGEIPFGAFVKRSATGTCIVAVDGSNTLGYEGIAEDSTVGTTTDGFYSTYDAVPVITAGRVDVWLQGGGTDVTSGCFLKLINDFGILALDSATTRSISTSVAKALEDVEVSDYTTSITSCTAGTKTVSVASTTYIAEGDYVYLTSSEGSEVEKVASVDSSTQITLEEAPAYSHETSASCNVLVQCEALLL